MAVSNITAATVNAFSSQQQSASQKSSQDQQNNPLAALQRKAASTSTQLSVFGKVKISLDDLQARAQVLKGFEKSPNLNDLKVAVQGFVQAFNTVNTVVTKTTQKQSALANARQEVPSGRDSRSTRALAEVSRAVSGPKNETSGSTLEKIGITREKNGDFTIDEKKLEKALEEDQAGTVQILADIGKRVAQAAEQQLASKTEVSGKEDDLENRANELDKLQNDSQQRLEAQKKTQQTQAAQLAPVSGTADTAAQNAVATYVGVSSL